MDNTNTYVFSLIMNSDGNTSHPSPFEFAERFVLTVQNSGRAAHGRKMKQGPRGSGGDNLGAPRIEGERHQFSPRMKIYIQNTLIHSFRS